MMFDYKDPEKIVAIFDWEMATIGDPYTDLGSTLAYWIGKNDPELGITSVTHKTGFYSRREFLERYSQLTNRDFSNINFYLAFGFYKLAGILQQLYYRWKINEIKDKRFVSLNKGINNLIELSNEAKSNKLL
ncbi:hypothetical protein EPH95_04360 [Salicibibacter halophilus]|uniref:Aminoglycoside phosphotransferase domain-containing protein n=1 Tax=Salicibibacter halophilus TaxID=2502791 RepID=A0A514LF76_9BACI|nr:phosphotransferase [Salicibibacter halophilus]QDI90508.1 hypothetical protein EPH95_04360 [Salicibibacter halophilus]